MIPYLDLKAQYAGIRTEIQRAINDVLDTQQYVLGPAVSAFEQAFAAYHGVEYGIAVNTGTSALHLETRYFLDCVASGTTPINDGRAGLRVVRMLEAADESLRRHRVIVGRPGRRRRIATTTDERQPIAAVPTPKPSAITTTKPPSISSAA